MSAPKYLSQIPCRTQPNMQMLAGDWASHAGNITTVCCGVTALRKNPAGCLRPSPPNKEARQKIDRLLEDNGWVVQDRRAMKICAPGFDAAINCRTESGHKVMPMYHRRTALTIPQL